MRLAALVSGGKDSLYAMHLVKKQGHEIKYIVSFISENPDSYMFHVPNAHLVREQAAAMEIPLLQVASSGEKEKELDDIAAALKKIRREIDGVVSGAVASSYQKSRIDKICGDLGLASFAPLWQQEQEKLLKDMLDSGFVMVITAVAAQGLDESWLGRGIDSATASELLELGRKHRFSAIGEGGEYESFVLDCPLFSERIMVKGAEKIWDAKTRSGVLRIKKIETVRKI